MATVYRDYGALSNQSYPANNFDVTKHRQVFLATHGGDDNRLPYMNRSFISFTFGGKFIEDFDLIATIDGNSLNRPGYANFNDNTTSYETLDGQYYWSTHYQANTLDLILSTDGIDQWKLDEFLRWFRAGETRELILAEHPNRAILARVSSPPQLNLLPFEEPVDVQISSHSYSTSTTLYKGDISLSLVMDEPHWYAIKNILGERVTKNGREYYDDVWQDLNTGEYVSIFASKDALKVLYEDGIPVGSMIEDNMLLGNGEFASTAQDIRSCIWNEEEEDPELQMPNTSGLLGGGAAIDGELNGVTYRGFIAGAMIDISGNGVENLIGGQEAYFYYSGTAPAPTIITFTMTPKMNSNNYIMTPKNTYTSVSNQYNTITIRSEHTQTLRFTTPNLFTSYNKVIKLFMEMAGSSTTYTWEDIRKKIRDNVRHPAVRAWANKVIECYTDDFSVLATQQPRTLVTYMSYLFKDSTGEIQPMTLLFNSQTGEATGTFKYRVASGNAPDSSSETLDDDWLDYCDSMATVQEDIGDMLKSNYIILQDRNYPTSNGKILRWRDTVAGHKNSHMFKHDCDVPLSNISILYKNMYL